MLRETKNQFPLTRAALSAWGRKREIPINHFRMNEFVDKGLKGLLGYVTSLTHYSFFNLEAAKMGGELRKHMAETAAKLGFDIKA